MIEHQKDRASHPSYSVETQGYYFHGSFADHSRRLHRCRAGHRARPLGAAGPERMRAEAAGPERMRAEAVTVVVVIVGFLVLGVGCAVE